MLSCGNVCINETICKMKYGIFFHFSASVFEGVNRILNYFSVSFSGSPFRSQVKFIIFRLILPIVLYLVHMFTLWASNAISSLFPRCVIVGDKSATGTLQAALVDKRFRVRVKTTCTNDNNEYNNTIMILIRISMFPDVIVNEIHM